MRVTVCKGGGGSWGCGELGGGWGSWGVWSWGGVGSWGEGGVVVSEFIVVWGKRGEGGGKDGREFSFLTA